MRIYLLLLIILFPALLFAQASLELNLASYRINDARSVAMGYTWNTNTDNYYPEDTDRWSFAVKDRLHLWGSLDDEATERFYQEDFNADYSSNFGLHKKFTELTVRSPSFEFNPDISYRFGLKYGTPIDLGYNVDTEIDFPDGTEEQEDMWSCGLTTLAPSFGVNFRDQFALGVHFYIPLSFGIEGESETKFMDFSSRTEQNWEFKGGTFFMIDAFARFDRLTVGASYQSSFKPEGDSYEIKNFNNGSLVFEDQNDGWDLEYPSMLQFGIAYEHSDRLNFAADVQFRNYEDYKINGEKAFGDVKNGLKFGLGAEYHFNENWTFQLGAALDKKPVADFEDDSPVSSYSIGGGLVTDLNRFLNFDQVENINFNGFIVADTWGRKVNEESEEYSETRFTLGSGLQVTF